MSLPCLAKREVVPAAPAEMLPELPFILSRTAELGTPFARILASVHLGCVRPGPEKSDCPSQMQPPRTTKKPTSLFTFCDNSVCRRKRLNGWFGVLFPAERSSPWVQRLCLWRTCEQPPAAEQGPGKARGALPLQDPAGGEEDVRGKHHLAQNWATPWMLASWYTWNQQQDSSLALAAGRPQPLPGWTCHRFRGSPQLHLSLISSWFWRLLVFRRCWRCTSCTVWFGLVWPNWFSFRQLLTLSLLNFYAAYK